MTALFECSDLPSYGRQVCTLYSLGLLSRFLAPSLPLSVFRNVARGPAGCSVLVLAMICAAVVVHAAEQRRAVDVEYLSAHYRPTYQPSHLPTGSPNHFVPYSRLLQATDPSSLAMESLESPSSDSQPSSNLTLLDSALILDARLVMHRRPLAPFLGDDPKSGRRLGYTVIRDIVFVPNSTLLFFVLHEYRYEGEPSELVAERTSFRKVDLEQVNQGLRTLAEDEVITYWWPYDEAVGSANASPFILRHQTDLSTSMADSWGMELTASAAYLIVGLNPTGKAAEGRPMIAAISTRNGSHVAVSAPADSLRGVAFNPNRTQLFSADSYLPCRILSTAVGESGLPIDSQEWKTVGRFTGSGARNISDVVVGRQTLVADGTCFYFFDRDNSRVWGIDPSSSTSPTAATLIAGSGNKAYADGDGLNSSFQWLGEIVATADGCNIFATDSRNGRLRWLKLDSPCSTARSAETVARSVNQFVRGLAFHEQAGEMLLYVGAGDGSLFELKLDRFKLHACASPSSMPADDFPPVPDSSDTWIASSSSSSPSSSADGTPSSAKQEPQTRSSSSSHSANRGVIVGVSLVSLALICAIACVGILCWKGRQPGGVIGRWRSPSPLLTAGASSTTRTTCAPSGYEGLELEGEVPRPMEMKRFPLTLLSHCTDGFSKGYRIGDSGAFGDVYWGSIGEQQVAIKLMSGELTPAKRTMFVAEVNTLSRLHHANLIGLLGYCDEGPRSILVYPYFPGGSLYGRLHRRKKAVPGKPALPSLTLVERICIALQIAKGLAYLHDGADPPIIHRDIKSSNVLLGDDSGERLHVVVADFGLARIGERVFGTEHETIVKTSHMSGTFGYMAPEYMLLGALTAKTDVYAFGVIALELLTGRKAVTRAPAGEGMLTLVDWAKPLLGSCHRGKSGVLRDEILEPCLLDQAAGLPFRNIVTEILWLVGECVAEDYRSRPTMSSLASTIAGLLKEANIGL